MTNPQHVDADILCLANTDTKLEWCDRRETCKRHREIKARAIGNGFGVLFRVCQPGAYDQFLEIP